MSDFCFKSGNIDSGGSELCEEKCVVEDDGTCQHPKNHIYQADNELSFLDNDGWLDIGNLEDVDRMLSCDFTFGMRSLNNEEEFCWFSSSHTAEGSDDALMSDLKLPCADMSPLKNISECNMDSSKDNIEVPLMNLDFTHAPNLTSISSTFSGPRAVHDVHMTPSLIESSYASNTECSQGHSLVAAALQTNENREKYHSHGHLSSRSFKNERRANEMQFHSPGSSQQVAHQFENENEGHSNVRGVSLGFLSETDSSNVQESSPISSGLDENSLHASSFGHLQQLLEQLDIRTKLCIRDSLYRLAKSADQRLNNSNCCIGDGTGACKDTMAQDASRCTGFIDIETNTNPIDRSIAHLLFHRPTDPSTLLQNDVTPFQSSATIHESTINPPVKAEKQVCQEGSSTDVEKNLVGGNA